MSLGIQDSSLEKVHLGSRGSSDALPEASLTLPDILSLRARETPTAPCVNVVEFSGGQIVARTTSYGERHAGVLQVAARLAGVGVRAGDRVLLAIEDAPRFFDPFLGAQMLGAVPVPLPGLRGKMQAEKVGRIRGVIADCGPSVLVTDDENEGRALCSELGQSLFVLPEEDGRTSPATPPCSSARLSDAAFIQYTSGSTASPKGVVVLHRNLVANLRAICEAGGIGGRDRIFSWLPLFHDMGLVCGLLLGVYAGIPTYVANPRTFVNRPDSWLRAISSLRATISPGPNFAYHTVSRVTPDRVARTLDLSTWRLAFSGAEVVDEATARGFLRRFGPCGFDPRAFRPAYGLAESVLGVAFPREGTGPRFDVVDRMELARAGPAVPVDEGSDHAVTYTSVGSALPGHSVTIVDPTTHAEVPERVVGEVVVRGPSVTPGYFAELRAGVPPRTALHTGDLGYLADGDLFLVDRLKDVLIIAGRKFIPSDLERVVGEIAGVRAHCVVAFSKRGVYGTEDLCIAAAFDSSAGTARDETERRIATVLVERFGVAPENVFLVASGALPRTTSGKLRRLECRSVFFRPDVGS